MNKEIRTAIIGYGNMGRRYAAAIRSHAIDGLRLTGICCRRDLVQQEIRRLYPEVSVYGDEADLFSHSDSYDALIIATPHREHVRLAESALLKGIHVLCEKPLGVSMLQAGRLTGIQRQSGAAFAMIFNWRTRPCYRRIKEIVEEGRLGRISHVIWIANLWYRTPTYHRLGPWRSSWRGEGGGLLINQMQHIFDIWLWLFGMPDAVRAAVEFGKFSEIAVDDSADLLFEYENGLRGICITSSGESPGSNHLEIHGSRGKLVADQETLKLYVNEVSTEEFAGREDGALTGIPFTESEPDLPETKEEYAAILQNFADHLLKGTALTAPASAGLAALEMANGAYLAAWLGRRVEYPVDRELYERLLKQKENAQLHDETMPV